MSNQFSGHDNKYYDGGYKGDKKGEHKGDNKCDNKGDSKGDHKGDNKGDSKGDSKGEHKGDNKGEHKGDHKDICGTVVNPKTLSTCENVYYPPVLSPTPVIAKVPVVLAERTVQVDIEAKIKLDQPAIEIKRIRKQLFLTQCKLLPRVGKLFLSGFIRKNIEFATAKCSSEDCVSGDIRHTTCNVPFDCVTVIPFDLGARPVFQANVEPTLIQTFSPKDLGADPCEQDFESVQNFNERIVCELVSVRFNEIDITCDDKKHGRGWNDEIEFQKITEKMTVFITFKLLQIQQVPIGGNINVPC